MYGKAPSKDTIYSEFVSARVRDVLGQGRGAYDIKELAFACGLKPTHNFKRRIMQLVAQHQVNMIATFTERGRITAVFCPPEVDCRGELPF
jgi:hypothetical protein